MSPRPLFLYSNPVDFGQPPDSGPGTDDGGVVDPYIRRFLEIGGPEVRRYQRYNALLASITKVAVAGELPTVLFCSALTPSAKFLAPVVFEYRAPEPVAVL